MSKFKVGDRVVIPKGTPYDPRQVGRWGTDWDVEKGDVTGEIIDIDPSGMVAVLNDDPYPVSGWSRAFGHVDYLRYADDYEPQPYDMPSSEADALDRIAEIVNDRNRGWLDVAAILRETGRL